MRKIILAITFSLNLPLLIFSSALADTHAYFDWLSSQPEVILSKAYRTQAEINADPYGGAGNVVYDETEDAARFTLPAGNGSDDASIPLHDQLRPTFPSTGMTSSNLFFFYELKHESGFVANGDVDGLEKHKATQIAKDTSRHQCIEPRYRYDLSNSPYVAKVDVRLYGEGSGYTEGPYDTIGPQTGEFSVLPDVWTRHWIFVDIANDKLWYWVGDENRSNVTILDGVYLDCSVVWPGDNFVEFWFEFNSSQQRDSGSPALYIWARNLVILKGISNASTLVAQGDSGNPPPDTPPPPLTGDVNDNGTVDIQDIQACVNHFLGTQNYGTAVDVNKDGKVNILDVQEIVNIILGS